MHSVSYRPEEEAPAYMGLGACRSPLVFTVASWVQALDWA